MINKPNLEQQQRRITLEKNWFGHFADALRREGESYDGKSNVFEIACNVFNNEIGVYCGIIHNKWDGWPRVTL